MKKLLLSTLVLLFAWQMSFACTASFTHTVTPVSGYPFRVVFTNTSVRGTASASPVCTLSFGDGTSATLPYPGSVTHNYAAMGTYTTKLFITVTDTLTATTCTDSVTEIISVSTTGVSVVSGSALNVDVFPNPAQQALHVAVYTSESQPMSFSVADVLGREAIAGVSYDMRAGRNVTDIPLGALRPGIYYLVAATKGATITRRFVISR